MIRNGSGKRAFSLAALSADAQLPGASGLRLSAHRFFGHAHTDFGWTDADALSALSRFAAASDIPFEVDRAFCPPACRSPHRSGVCFDVGAALPRRTQSALRLAAIRSGLFYRVDSEVESPCCVHLTCLPPPRVLAPGDAGVYVFVLQHALRSRGFYTGADTGQFCELTARAVYAAAAEFGLKKAGIADAALWHAIDRR